MHRILIPFAATAIVVSTTSAFACACCAEANTYSVVQKIWNSGIRSMMARLRHVRGKLSEQGPDARHDDLQTTGLSVERTGVSVSVAGGGLQINHRGKYFERATDITAFVPGGEPGVKLLKEYVFRGTVRFSGVLARRYGGRPVPGYLVLKAVGNRCGNASGFRAWTVRFRAGGRSILGGGRIAGR